MRAHRLAALGMVLIVATSCGADPESDSAAARIRTVRPHATVATTTTVTAAPFVTTTTSPPAPRIRASRSLNRPRPTVAAQPQRNGTCDDWTWRKTRAESDACWRPFVAQWGDWNHNTALSVIWAESRGDSFAKNGKHIGLFQIANAYGSQGHGAANIALAHEMWMSRGWQPWRSSGRWSD